MAWTMRPLLRQAESKPSTVSHRCWRIDLTLIRSEEPALVTEPDYTLDLESPFDNAFSIPILPSQWYLASPSNRLPLIFDIAHHRPDLSQLEGWHEASRFRLNLSHSASRERHNCDTSPGSAPALSVERVSRFRFPPCILSFTEQVHIPGWFSVGMSPPLAPGSMAYHMICIYEPGVGFEEADSDSRSEWRANSIDEEVEFGFGGVAGGALVEAGTGTRTPSARLSMLYQGSTRGVGACVSGRAAHACSDLILGYNVCVLDQDLFPHETRCNL